MFKKVEFIRSVYNISDLPKEKLPEVVICGRSNVGKSTFINTLFNRKNLAKTSSTPGKTRSINFYNVDDVFYAVDLPGFGYAKISQKERESWKKLINSYFINSSNVSLVFHLIDSRHKPLETDIQLNQLLNSLEIPFIILLNKVDKLKQSEIAGSKKQVMQYFPELSIGDNLIFTSSVKGTGKKEILKRLSALFYK